VAVAALGGAIALVSHGSKIAVRAAVTPSPEPFSNIALSFTEDVAAISLTWFATQHPIIAGIIVTICLVLAILAIRYLVRAFRRLIQQLRALLHPSSVGLT
jgi:cobalamin biosynthesis protein CobD/CbiB